MGPYTIAEIVVYPVKSCKGISVSSAAISSTGWSYPSFSIQKDQMFPLNCGRHCVQGRQCNADIDHRLYEIVNS